MEYLEYLIRYGLAGDFGRFRADRPLALPRGTRVVVRSDRGAELGEVMRPTRPRHAVYLPNTSVGRLLRPAEEQDEVMAQRCAEKASALLRRASELVCQLSLPIECLDAEVLLDGDRATLLHVRWGEGDVRELVRPLSREFAVSVELTDLTTPQEHEHGCGSCGSGGCGSCGKGEPGCVSTGRGEPGCVSSGRGEPGCVSTGSGEPGCVSSGSGEPGCVSSGSGEMQEYFASLREKMERKRVNLL